MKIFLTFALVLLPIFIFAAPAPIDKLIDRPRVLIEEVKPLMDKKRIIVPVKVEAKIQSLVSADIEGNVTRILKPLGSSVNAGEVILFLENRDPGFTYAAVPVRSLVNGIISQMWTSQMAKVNRGDKLFTVINPKSLKLSAEFPSSELPSVHAGLSGQFKMDSQKELSLPLRVVGISPLVDSRTGTASAELEFSSVKLKELPPIGSIGQATFEINQGTIILIPEASLVFQNGKSMVRVVTGKDHFSKKPIELGQQRDSSFIVTSGIEKGDKIVVRSSRPLKEGEAIEIESAAEKKQ